MQILSHYSNWQFSWREKHWTPVPASNDTSRVRKKNGGPLGARFVRRSGDKRRCTVKVIT